MYGFADATTIVEQDLRSFQMAGVQCQVFCEENKI
jgi:hypothetical protein